MSHRMTWRFCTPVSTAQLNKACEERAGWIVFLKVEPLFDPLRSDPRFAGLVHRVGLPIDPGNSQRMWIGTDIGVFESNDGGVTWLADDGLPNVVVTELRVRETNDALRAATYGWGMWQRRIVPPYASVDVYVRDNKMDTGETSPAPYDVVDPQVVGNKLYFWESPDIKVSFSSLVRP